MPRARRFGSFLLVFASLATAAIVASPVASATPTPPQNPTHNATLPSPTACRNPNNPLSPDCTAAMLAGLDAARKALNGSTYSGTLPQRFVFMTPTEQLLMLTNSDRKFYGLPSVLGFNATLNSAAVLGVKRAGDPPLTNTTVSGNRAMYLTSNWAAGTGSLYSPLGAYFLWMYADSATHWDHRDSTLHRYLTGQQVFMGAAGGPMPGKTGWYSWTDIFESFAAANTVPEIATITTMSTYSVSAPGGQTFIISAYGLRKVTQVVVCGIAAKFTVTSSTKISVIAPTHTRGTAGHVIIHTGGGVSSTTPASAFNYT